jgi:phytase-like protein
MVSSRITRTHVRAALAALAAAATIAGCGLGRREPAAEASQAPRPDPLPAGAITLTPVGRFDFTAPRAATLAVLAEELSGIAWLEGDHYVAIGDEHATMHRLEIELDRETGRIERVHFERAIPLLDEKGGAIPDSIGSDREGIEVNPDGTVCISNERTGADQGRPSIACHRLDDGRMTRLIRTEGQDMLRVFSTERLNGGFEALTRRPDTGEVWTANEMPLTIDGDPPTDSTGAVVRLQKLDRELKPVAQYAYRLDSYPQKITIPPKLRGYAVNGLSEMLALPGGGLLTLERTFAGDSSGLPNLRIRIYQVDLAGATDVSALGPDGGLRHASSYVPVAKRLLWEKNFGLSNSNFEGMTLGPQLKNGDFPLILVADNNGGEDEALFALRVSGVATAPSETSARPR